MSLSVPKVSRAFHALLNLVYPIHCLCCEVALDDQSELSSRKNLFCSVCWSKVTRLDGPLCPLCAEPFQSEVTLTHSADHFCHACRVDLPAFSQAVTPYLYEETLAKGICLLKYQKHLRLVSCFVDLLLGDLRSIKFDRVIAIPLHHSRLRSREFNQSLLLAKGVSSHFGRPLLIDVLRRTRETLAQVGLTLQERKKNVRKAFQVVNSDSVLGQRLLLIDDVYTTGATLREGAKVLMNAGAKEVIVSSLCRMVTH